MLWIVYRRLWGETLGGRLKRIRVLPLDIALGFFDQVLRGLQAAHDAGVVHRDVTPPNIYLERLASCDRASLLDFGISKYIPGPGHSTGQQPLTSTSETLGTAQYMSPEQIEGASTVDLRTDLYAVASVLFEALTGVLAVAGESPLAIMHAKLSSDPRTLASATRLAWPSDLEAFFREGLARSAEARFASAAAMRRALPRAAGFATAPSADLLRARLGPLRPQPSEKTLDAPPSSGQRHLRWHEGC